MIGPFIANLTERLFAYEEEPYIPRNNNREDIELDFGGTRLGFSCPPASVWGGGSTSRVTTPIDLTNKALYLPPDKALVYTHNLYRYCDIFYREWKLYGSLVRLQPIALASLTIRVVEIPKRQLGSSLFDFDYLREVFPNISRENFPDLMVGRTGGGILRKLCPTRAHFNSVGHQGDNERQYYFRIFIVLDSEHVIALDFYLVRPPITPPLVKNGFYDFIESIENSLYVHYSDEVNAQRVQAEVKFSERHDCVYDEEFGPCFVMDLDGV